MKKLLWFFLCLWAAPAWAQNHTCTTRSPGDNSNACASTAFVGAAIAAIPPPVAAPLTIGSTTVSGATSGYALYNNSGILGAQAFPINGVGSGSVGQACIYDGTNHCSGQTLSLNSFPYQNPGTGAVSRTVNSKLSDIYSATDFASGSVATTTGTISAGSNSLTLALAKDFVNGQGIRINHAGVAFTGGVPTALSATQNGSSSGTAYSYQVECIDGNGGVGVAAGALLVGTTAVSTTNPITLNWSAGSGCTYYAVFRNGVLVNIVAGAGITDPGFRTFTIPDWIPSTPNGTALADWLVTSITGGGGTTTLTLAANAITTASSQPIDHDDTVGLQNWINACTLAKADCLMNALFNVTSELEITDTVSLRGTNRQWAGITIVSPSQNGFNITTANSVFFHQISVISAGEQAAGNAFIIQPSTSENSGSVFDELYTYYNSTSFSFVRASLWQLTNTQMIFPQAQAVVVQNLNNGDSGDSNYEGNLVFYNYAYGNSSLVGLYWESSGGLRVHNNKFLNGFRGLQYTLQTGVNTGTLLVEDNSIENFYNAGILVSPQTAGNGSIIKFNINNNEFLGDASAYGIWISAPSAQGWLSALTIVGNNIQINSNAIAGASPHGIDMTFCQAAAITGNSIFVSPNSANAYGILIASSVAGIGHSGNAINGFSGSNTAVSDSSTSPVTPY